MKKMLLFLMLPYFSIGMEEEKLKDSRESFSTSASVDEKYESRLAKIYKNLEYEEVLEPLEAFEKEISGFIYLTSEEFSKFCLSVKIDFINCFFKNQHNEAIENAEVFYDLLIKCNIEWHFHNFDESVKCICEEKFSKELSQILLIQDFKKRFEKMRIDIKKKGKHVSLSAIEESISPYLLYEDNKDKINQIYKAIVNDINDEAYSVLQETMPTIREYFFKIKTIIKKFKEENEMQKFKLIFEFLKLLKEKKYIIMRL